MAIRLSSWNLEGRLSAGMARGERGTPEKILDRIEDLDADVMVLPDAFMNNPAEGVDERLKAMGYDWRDIAYEDRHRPEQVHDHRMPYMRILSRLAIVSHEELRWADVRNMLAVTVQDPETEEETEIVGIHMSDLKSTYRRDQVKEGAVFLSRDTRARVAVGDWNEAHPRGLIARVFGSKLLQFLARSIPSRYELSDDVTHDDLRGYAMRSTDMTAGEALACIEQATDLRDLDLRHRATATPKIRGMEWLPSIRLLQLDHAYASSNIQATPVEIGKDHGSDHRDISTTLHLK